MYTTPGLELLLRMKTDDLQRALREQHATSSIRRTSTPHLRARVATTLAAVRRRARPTSTLSRRSPASTVPCCA